MSASVPSGMPMCMKMSSEKKRSPIRASLSKLAASGSENSGSASSYSVVATIENCASRYHTSQKPPMPDSQTNSSSATPVSHAKRCTCA